MRSSHTGHELRPRDPTHLAGDTLLLCNKDVLLPQSLLQPLRSQHGLAGLQSCCNTERQWGCCWGHCQGYQQPHSPVATA